MAELDVNPDGELTQEYVLPDTVMPPIEVGVPAHIVVFDITEAAGNALTVIVTEFDFEQLFEFVSVRVYIVVTVGETDGLAILEVNPDGELLHE